MIKGLRAEIWEKEPKRVSQFSLSEEVRGLLKVRYHLPGSWRMRRIGLDEEKRKLARGQSKYEGRGLRRAWYAHKIFPWG